MVLISASCSSLTFLIRCAKSVSALAARVRVSQLRSCCTLRLRPAESCASSDGSHGDPVCVMQHRGMLIQGDDIAVRHVGATVTGRGEVRLIDIELCSYRTEGFMRCIVVTYSLPFLRFTHAVKFVVGFIRAVIVQEIQHPFRAEFVCRDIQTQRTPAP